MRIMKLKQVFTPTMMLGILLGGTSSPLAYRLIEYSIPGALRWPEAVALGLFLGVFFGMWAARR
jgi:hypothetical protein